MKKRNLLYGILMITLIGCGAESIAELFVADISNPYKSSRNSTFIFNAAKSNVNESDFSGSERDAASNFTDFTGHFKNYDINFQFSDGPDKGLPYSGKFIKGSNPLVIKVTAPGRPELTLTKDVQP